MLTFLGYAMGSLQEVDSQLLVAKDLGFAQANAFPEVEERVGRVGRMLSGLRSALESGMKKGPR